MKKKRKDLFDRIGTCFVRCGLCHDKPLPCDHCLELTKKANGWDDAELARQRDIERRYTCDPKL